MSQRRLLLERQYLDSSRKSKKEGQKEKFANPLLEKVCRECGSKASACFSDDGGKNWYCYGHRPDASEEDRLRQTKKNKAVEEQIRARMSKASALPKRKKRVSYEPVRRELGNDGAWW